MRKPQRQHHASPRTRPQRPARCHNSIWSRTSTRAWWTMAMFTASYARAGSLARQAGREFGVRREVLDESLVEDRQPASAGSPPIRSRSAAAATRDRFARGGADLPRRAAPRRTDPRSRRAGSGTRPAPAGRCRRRSSAASARCPRPTEAATPRPCTARSRARGGPVQSPRRRPDPRQQVAKRVNAWTYAHPDCFGKPHPGARRARRAVRLRRRRRWRRARSSRPARRALGDLRGGARAAPCGRCRAGYGQLCELRQLSAIRRACDGGVRRSRSPAITSVGTVSRGSAWWSSILGHRDARRRRGRPAGRRSASARRTRPARAWRSGRTRRSGSPRG